MIVRNFQSVAHWWALGNDRKIKETVLWSLFQPSVVLGSFLIIKIYCVYFSGWPGLSYGKQATLSVHTEFWWRATLQPPFLSHFQFSISLVSSQFTLSSGGEHSYNPHFLSHFPFSHFHFPLFPFSSHWVLLENNTATPIFSVHSELLAGVCINLLSNMSLTLTKLNVPFELASR